MERTEVGKSSASPPPYQLLRGHHLVASVTQPSPLRSSHSASVSHPFIKPHPLAAIPTVSGQLSLSSSLKSSCCCHHEVLRESPIIFKLSFPLRVLCIHFLRQGYAFVLLVLLEAFFVLADPNADPEPKAVADPHAVPNPAAQWSLFYDFSEMNFFLF